MASVCPTTSSSAMIASASGLVLARDHADRAVDLQDGELDAGEVSQPLVADGRHQVLLGQSLAAQAPPIQPAALDEDRRHADHPLLARRVPALPGGEQHAE